MVTLPEELPASDIGSAQEALTAPVFDLATMVESASVCPAVTDPEWVFIRAAPLQSPIRLATVLLLHTTPDIDTEQTGQYFYLRTLGDNLEGAPKRTAREKELLVDARQKLAKVALYGEFAAFIAIAQEGLRRVANTYQQDFEDGATGLEGLARRRARLRDLFTATDRPNPILAQLAVIRQASGDATRLNMITHAERLIRLLMLDDGPRLTVQ